MHPDSKTAISVKAECDQFRLTIFMAARSLSILL